MSDNSPIKINIGKGLLNLGNTCYLNTVVQMISVFPEFHSFQSKSPLYKKRNQSPILIQWNDILQQLLSSPPTPNTPQAIHPGIFIETLFQNAKSKSFQPVRNEPQDAAEFLQFLIEEFHQIIAHPVKAEVQGIGQNSKDDMAKICYDMLANVYQTSYSEIYPLCYGIMVSTLTPLSIVSNSPFTQQYGSSNTPTTPIESNKKERQKPISLKPESFFLLPVPLPPCPPYQSNATVSLYQCLDQIIAPEVLDNENAWFDEKLGYKRPVTKQTIFWNFPPILTITLQRLLPDGNKDNRIVQFPLKYLDLSPYVHGYNKDQYVYELMAIGLHHGNLGGGHYTAIIRKGEECSQWVHYNDQHIKPLPLFPPDTPESSVQQELEKILHHPDVYCLLYRKMI